AQRTAVETAAHVQHRQQRDADAGVGRGAQQRARHRRRILVAAATRRVVQVVELADAGVAGLEHLRVQLRRDRVQRVRVEALGHAVHGLAPGPERLLGIALALGHAGHRPLERVGVQVRDAGEREHADILARPPRQCENPGMADRDPNHYDGLATGLVLATLDAEAGYGLVEDGALAWRDG